MKIICRYSKVSFHANFFNDLPGAILGQHPIMDVETRILLSRATDWASGKLSDIEKRLLFVALLKKTELIEWHVPAEPSDRTIAQNMELLIKTLGWKYATGYKFSLPRFSMNKGTSNCRSIGNWLARWNEEKDYILSRKSSYEFRQKLELREKALSKLLLSAKKTPSYFSTLGKWVMDVSDAPAAIRDIWMEIFTLDKDTKIWAANTIDIENLLQHMVDFCPADSIYGHAAFKHIRSILIKNRGGIEFGLGMTALEDIDFEDIKKQGFYLLPSHKSSLEHYSDQQMIANAPTSEPIPSDYSSNIEYYRAKIRWKRKLEALAGQAEFEERKKKLDTEWNESNITASEEDGLLDEEDDELLGQMKKKGEDNT